MVQLSVEALAKYGIEQSYQDNPDSINLSQPWANEFNSLQLDYGTVSGKLIDAQACFNINALAGLETDAGSSQVPFWWLDFKTYLKS